MGQWSELTLKDHQVLREDVGLEPLPVQLGLKPEKSQRQSDTRQRRKSKPRKKPTRYKNIDTKKKTSPKK
jgi:hypothetical protein